MPRAIRANMRGTRMYDGLSASTFQTIPSGVTVDKDFVQTPEGYVLGYTSSGKSIVMGRLECTGTSVTKTPAQLGLTTVDYLVASGCSMSSAATPVTIMSVPIEAGTTQWSFYAYVGAYMAPNTSNVSIQYFAIGTL